MQRYNHEHINEDDFNLFAFKIALLFLPSVLFLFFLRSGQRQPLKLVFLHTSLLMFTEIFGWKWQESHSNHFQKKGLCNQTSKYQGWTDFVVGEDNGTPLHYSCLENPMDRGAWWAAVHGVAKSLARLKQLSACMHTHRYHTCLSISLSSSSGPPTD